MTSHHFDESAFDALPAAKAKAGALAMFSAAMLEPAPDWRAVAYALHAVVNRARGKAAAVAVTEDDADGFNPWNDERATGKPATMGRGKARVTFADGWICLVDVSATRTAKGLKPWAIGPAVRFAVLKHKLATARRVTGSDAVMYHDLKGHMAGVSVALDGLLSAPEIVAVELADGQDTREGDGAWNPDHANAATLDTRAGRVTVPDMIGPFPQYVIEPEDAPETAEIRARIGAARAAMLDEITPPAPLPRSRELDVICRDYLARLAWFMAPDNLAKAGARSLESQGFWLSQASDERTAALERRQTARRDMMQERRERMAAVSALLADAAPYQPCEFHRRRCEATFDGAVVPDDVHVAPEPALDTAAGVATVQDDAPALDTEPAAEAPAPEPVRAPLMLAGPPVLLCLPKPSPATAKPRYRLTAAGTFERVAA